VGVRLKGDLRRVMRAHDFDVVHTHSPNAPTLPVLAVQVATCAQVGTFHTTAGRSMLQDLWQDYLARTVERLDQRIAVSKTAEASATLYYPGEYHIIPNGVDVERFHPGVSPFEEWRTRDRVNLLFVGRLDPRKGLQYLIAAMPDLLERTKNRARLLIIGDSYLRPRFEAMVPACARPHVRFLGHVPSQDLPRWYATGDIFVSPASGNESFGIVLVEAMAAGRVVVASDIPGYRSVITPGDDGVMFPPGDVPALARAITGLVEDPVRRERVAEHGRQRALAFAWPRVTDQIEAVYRQALGQRANQTACHSAA
ncbi:MAG TPA: glycosyltransferase family 4 protein, partial [Terriglobales bacterium]|nr:glycosyltransferase family 4 protein [Terriglobales bacterium]